MKQLIYSLLLLALTACSTPKEENKLIVGLQSDYPPFEYLNDQGEIIGFDVDLAKALAQKLGKELVIHDMEFDGQILSLKQGKIDLIISGTNITPSRQKEITLVPYHGDQSGSLSLLFWGEVQGEIHSLDDIKENMVVSVESGSIADHYLEKYPAIHKRTFQNALEPLMDVKYGKSNAALTEADIGEHLRMKYPEVRVVVIPLPEAEKSPGFGIGIKKENIGLTLQVEKAIQELKLDGTIPKLEKKWFKGE